MPPELKTKNSSTDNKSSFLDPPKENPLLQIKSLPEQKIYEIIQK